MLNHLTPPAPSDSVPTWEAWLAAEAVAARTAKAARTRATAVTTLPDTAAMYTRQGGVWRQSVSLTWDGAEDIGYSVAAVAPEADSPDAALTRRQARGRRGGRRRRGSRARTERAARYRRR